jgi:hypothetical protein
MLIVTTTEGEPVNLAVIRIGGVRTDDAAGVFDSEL